MPDITIYTRRFCGYCAAATRLLGDKGATFSEIDATGSREKRQEMQDRSGRMTFPQIFVGDRHVGGFSELRALDLAGKLDPMLRPGGGDSGEDSGKDAH
ncbi:MAG: glutaredoxin 3 [Alphaproteobacteria bacterium]